MKNLWNWAMSTLGAISRMTLKQRVILIGFIILPGASLILISLLFVQRITQKREKEKITMTCGSLITEEEMYKDLTHNID
jgi:hypothetical protein